MGIERNEFENAVALIRADIKGVHDRLDALNGRTRKNEIDIALLQQSRSDAAWIMGGLWALFVAGIEWFLHGRSH